LIERKGASQEPFKIILAESPAGAFAFLTDPHGVWYMWKTWYTPGLPEKYTTPTKVETVEDIETTYEKFYGVKAKFI
jgi:hypothetical protein